MGKYRYLLQNMGLLTLSSFATKLLSFFLMPLYTSILSTADYGTYDLINTTVSLLIPVLTLDIQEAVLRFALDDGDKERVLLVGLKYFVISLLVVIAFTGCNLAIGMFEVFAQYPVEFVLMYAAMSLSGILSYYARGVEHVSDLSISSVLSSFISIVLNIYFLVVLRIGLLGYFYATIIGSLVMIVYLCFSLHLFGRCVWKSEDSSLEHDMTKYSAPMIANAVSWWVNNASDRYIVTWICGVAVNGVYAVSYKIPSIISVLQSIFGQAWTISAVKDFDKNDTDGFYIKIYNLYNGLLVLACTMLIFLVKPLAKILFANDFYSAWMYSPFLMIGTVFSGMAAFVGGLFSALKKSRSFAQTSVVSAAINVIGNLVFVPIVGPFGASVTTATSYLIMLIMRIYLIRKDVNLAVDFRRDFLSYVLLILQGLALCFDGIESVISWYQIIFVAAQVILFRTEASTAMQRVGKAVRHGLAK
jgi:O-antigen/teichoic acid export membrane protein